MLDSLPSELIFDIFLLLPCRDILNCSRLSSFYHNCIITPHFWKLKFNYDYFPSYDHRNDWLHLYQLFTSPDFTLLYSMLNPYLSLITFNHNLTLPLFQDTLVISANKTIIQQLYHLLKSDFLSTIKSNSKQLQLEIYGNIVNHGTWKRHPLSLLPKV